MTIKFYRHYLIYKYNFTFSLFCTTYKLTNDKKIIQILKEVCTFRPFLTFSFQLPSLPKLKDWQFMINQRLRDYTDEDFCKVMQVFSYKLLNFLHCSDKSNRRRNIGYFFCRYCSQAYSPPAAADSGFSVFYAWNLFLFQIKVNAENIKETNCAAQFYVIKRHLMKKQSSLNMKIENMLQRFSCISFLFKPPCSQRLLSDY